MDKVPSYFRLSTIHWQSDLILNRTVQGLTAKHLFALLSAYENDNDNIVPLDSDYSLLLTVLS